MKANSAPSFSEAKDFLRPILQSVAKHFDNRAMSADGVDLYTKKAVVVGNRPASPVFFGALQEQKGHLGFYFMPIYTHPHEFNDLSPMLKKKLKGKSCFHFKQAEPELENELKSLVAKGVEVYKKAGWI